MSATTTTRSAKAAERKARDERIAASQAATREVVALGTCPLCFRPLRRNLSLTGWWQCSQLGAETHRADPTQPSCSWQGFTS